MGRTAANGRRRGAWLGAIGVVVAVLAVAGVARSAPAEAGLARINAAVCLDLDLSLAISVDAGALIDLGDLADHDHIAAAVRFRTDVGVITDWQPLADSPARRFDAANGHHFDDNLVIVPVAAAVAVQVRLEAVGPWSDGTVGGLVELDWTPTPSCGATTTPGGLLPDVGVDVDADLDVDGLIDLDADVDADIDLGLGGPGVTTPPLPVPVPTVPTVPSTPTTPAAPVLPIIDLDADLDLDIDLDLGVLPIIPVGGPIVAPPAPPTPTNPSDIGISARVRCGVGLDADLDLVLAGRPGAASHVVVTHPDSLLAIDLDLGAGTTQVIPLTDVLLGHRILDVLVDGVDVDIAVDLSCPIDLGTLLTPTCSVTDDGLHVHLASRLDATLALLLGVNVIDPATGVSASALLQAGADVDLHLAVFDDALLEIHAQLLGIDLSVGVLTCTAPQVTPTTTAPTTPTTATPTTTTPANPNTPTTTTPANPNTPTTTTPANPNTPTTTTPATPNTPAPTTTVTPTADPLGSGDPTSVQPASATRTPSPVATTQSTGSLPITGTNSLVLIAAAAALVASGTAILRISRRRHPAARD